MKKTVICLIGPTAAGKSEVALQLAKKIKAEIISCDSMQVYQGADIATAQPTEKQRKAIPHHLTNIIKPSEEYNAARFRVSAQKIIKDIHKRKKIPLIVAGTGLYLRALLDGLFVGPGQNACLRKKFSQQAQRYGTTYIYAKLKKLDPQAAKGIHPHDLRRIIRALEVYELSGRPISQMQQQARGIRGQYALYIFGLRRKRDELYGRIENRVDRMFRQGLVAEIKKLTKRKASKTAQSLLGYKEIRGFLNGEYSKDEAGRLLKRNTRRYAKRQLSWFRKEKGVKWIEIGPNDASEIVVKKILAQLCGRPEETKKKNPFC